MADHCLVRTERLDLAAVTEADVDDLYALSSDPRVWQHFPSGRHTERDKTAQQVAVFLAGWAEHGLGYWTAHLRSTGEFLGVGGCMSKGGIAWNVYYRFRPEAQGNGYATELVTASLVAAAEVNPELAVVAYLLEHNLASRKTAERAGLQLVWRGPDAGNPDPQTVRLVYADRPLGEVALHQVTAFP